MDTAEIKNVEITYFASPYFFWIKPLEYDEDFFGFDMDLQNYFHKHSLDVIRDFEEVFVGETIGFYLSKGNKLLRGLVQKIDDRNTIQVWAVDFGFPSKVELKYTYKLPSELKSHQTFNIKCCGINNTVPIAQSFDEETFQVEFKKCQNWSSDAIDTANKIIKKCKSINFIKEMDHNSQSYGKLIFFMPNDLVLDLSEVLKKMKLAEISECFEQELSIYYSSKMQNDRLGKMLNKRELVESYFINYSTPMPSKAKSVVKGATKSTSEYVPMPLTLKSLNEIERQNAPKPPRIDVNTIDLNAPKFNRIPGVRPPSPTPPHVIEYTSSADNIKEPSVKRDQSSGKHSKTDEMKRLPIKNVKNALTVVAKMDSKITDYTVRRTVLQEKIMKNYSSDFHKSSELASDSLDSSNSEKFKHLMLDSNDSLKEMNDRFSSRKPTTSHHHRAHNISIDSDTPRDSTTSDLVSSSSESKRNTSSPLDDDNIESVHKLTKKAFNTRHKVPTQSSSVERSKVEPTNTLKSRIIVDVSEPRCISSANNTEDNQSVKLPESSQSALYNLSFLQLKKKKILEKLKKQQDRKQALMQPKVTSPTQVASLTSPKKESPAPKVRSSEQEIISPLEVGSSDQKEPSPSEIISPKTKPESQLLSTNFEPYHYIMKPTYSASAKKLAETQLQEMTHMERGRRPLVLVHGQRVPKPLERIEDADFTVEVFNAMENLRILRPFRTHCFVWPHLMRNSSIVIIGAEKTGKTMAFLPALLSLVISNKEDGLIPDGIGPIAIILAASAKHVEKTYNNCQLFNRCLPVRLNIVEGYGIRNQKQLHAFFYNGMDILVITPGALARVLASSDDFVNTERLQHIVFDDIHLMNENVSSLKNIWNLCCVKNTIKENPPQLIITSLYWKTNFMDVFKLSNNPLLCISSYIEAAYYAKINLKLLVTLQGNKFEEIGKVIADNKYLYQHTLFVCTENEEVKDVVEYLEANNIACIGCTDSTTPIEIKFVNDWNYRKSNSLEIIVCTDATLPELQLNNVIKLIHFSLSITWTRFTLRFSTLFNSFSNMFTKNADKNTNEYKKTSSVIFVDESNNKQLPRLVDFLEKHGVESIQDEIQEIAKQIRLHNEMDKMEKKEMFCKYFLNFGFCRKQNTCRYRHLFTSNEKTNLNDDICKLIKLKINEVYSPTHYSAEILSTRKSVNEKWTDFDRNEFQLFDLEFRLHYAMEKNHISHHPVAMNDLCAIQQKNKFYRCKILHVATKKSTLSYEKVLVKTIDEGQVFECMGAKLLHLPDKFKAVPARSLDIRLGGIAPVDCEYNWDSDVTHCVNSWIKEHTLKKGCYIQGCVSFLLNDSIWIESIDIVQDLKTFGGEIYLKSIKSSLVKMKYCVYDEGKFEDLKKNALSSGLKVFHRLAESEKEGIPDDLEDVNAPEDIAIESDGSFSADESKHSATDNKMDMNSVDCDEIISNEDNDATQNKNDSISDNTTNYEKTNGKTIDLSQNGEDNEEKEGTTPEKTKSDPILNTNSIKSERNTQIKKYQKPRTNWETLGDEITEVHMTFFDNPSSFYVQRLSCMQRIKERDEDIYAYLKFSDNEELEEATVGSYCLAPYEDVYNRGLILNVSNENSISVFLCDLGNTFTFKTSELRTVSDEIMSSNFEVIKCSLYGVAPITTDGWSEQQNNDIYYDLIDKYETFYLQKVETRENVIGNPECVYAIVMHGRKANNSGYDNLNKEMITKEFGIYSAGYVSDVLDGFSIEFQQRPNIPQVGQMNMGLNIEELEFDMTDEELKDFLKHSGLNLPKFIDEPKIPLTSFPSVNEQIGECTATITEITEESSETKNTETEYEIAQVPTHQICSNINKQLYGYDMPPELISTNNFLPPETYWHQNSYSITISINVMDHKHFKIEMEPNFIYLLVEYEHKVFKELCLNLFGVIDVNHSAYEIRGNTLYFHLLKALRINLLWPMLLVSDIKHHWLKYNLNAIKDDGDVGDDDAYRYKTLCDDEPDSDDMMEDNEDDACDPFSMAYEF